MDRDQVRTLNGRYRLLRQVGEGGLGALFRAVDENDGSVVAVKLLRREHGTAETLAHLRHEFRLLSSLHHPNLAEVHDFARDESTGEWFFTSEFVEGRDLLTATAHLLPDDVYPLVAQVCAALDYLHARGLVHYDVKPDNLLAAGKGAEARVKLVDFDLAGSAREGRDSSVKGTVHYIAPEVVRSAPVDHRADLYSLGVTLFQVFYRCLPFEGGSQLETLRLHLYEEPRLPSTAKGLPAPLGAVILRLLAKAPADRPQSAAEVVRTLSWVAPRALADESAKSLRGRLLPGRLVEREEPLAELARLRDAALRPGDGSSSGAGLLLVAGPAGVGKSRLLRELRCLTQVEGLRVLAGKGRGEDQPLGLWLDVLADGRRREKKGVTSAGPATGTATPPSAALEATAAQGPATAFAAGVEAEAATVEPAWRPRPTTRDAGRLGDAAEEAQFDAQARVVAAVLEQARPQPLLVLLEDLGSADAGSLAVLEQLLRALDAPGAGAKAGAEGETAPARLLLCAELRDEELEGRAAASSIARLLAHARSRRLLVQPLSADGTARLVSSMLAEEAADPGLCKFVHERTGGVPARVEEALRALVGEGRVACRAGRWGFTGEAPALAELDRGSGDLEGKRLRRLPVATRRLLETLAVADAPCGLDLLERASGLSTADLDLAVLELEREGVADAEAGPGTLRIRSGPMAAAAYRLLDKARRVQDHRAFAEELARVPPSERRPGHAEGLARHLERSGQAAEAVPAWLAAGAEARARGAWDAALRDLERAAALGGHVGPWLPDLLYEKACVLHDRGRLAEATAALEGGLVALAETTSTGARRPPGRRERGELLLLLGRVRLEKGEPERAEEDLRAARAAAGDRDLATPELAACLSARGLHDEAVSLCDEALARAAAGAANAALRVARGKALAGLRRFEESLASYHAALEALSAAGAPPSARIDVLQEMGAAHVEAGDYANALAVYREALSLATRGSRVSAVWSLQVNLAYVATQNGDLAVVEEHLRAAEDLARVLGLPAALSRVLSNLGTSCVAEGRFPEAEHHYRRALELMEGGPDRAAAPGLLTNLAISLAGQDRFDEAEEVYRRSLDEAERAGQPLRIFRALSNLAGMLLTLGRYEEAAAAADRATEAAEANGLESHSCYSLYLRAAIALERGERSGVPGFAERAVAAARRAGPRRLASALVELAEARRSLGDLENAAAALDEARPLLEGLGVRQVLVGMLRAQAHVWLDEAERAGESAKAVAAARRAADALRAHLAETPRHITPEDSWPLQQLLARALRLAGDAAPAEDALAAALDTMFRMAERIPARWRRAYFARPPVLDLLAEAAAQRVRLRGAVAGAASPGAGAVGGGDAGPSEEAGTAGAPAVPREGVLALSMLARVLEAGLDEDRMLDLALASALQVTRAERGFVVLREPDGSLSVRRSRNFDDREIDSPSFQFSRSVCRKVAESRAPLRVDDALRDDSLKARRSIANLRIRSVLAAPLLLEQDVLGVLYLDHRTGAQGFSASDLALVSEFARRLAVPLSNTQTHAKSVAEEHRLRRQIESLSVRFHFHNILGESPAMQKLFHALERVAATELPILLHGESGTGKELVARAIHFNGPRKAKAFVAENCGALSTPLLESELFGHRKGSFTGAGSDREGLFAMANGGTLLLDEVGEMSPDLQKKLLRVLQEGEVRPVGATHSIRVDCRIIAATHRDLRAMVREGQFREDLYFRLGVVDVKIPPLRERREDIPLLAQAFLEEAARGTSSPGRRFADETLRYLCDYAWPGNVRELQNEVRKLVALGGAVLTSDLLSPGLKPARASSRARHGLKDRVGEIEREAIRKALDANGWNIRKTAPLLGLNRMSLARRMKKYGLVPPGS